MPASDIVIGLVNIMPHSAIRTTENLFRLLLQAVSPNHKLHLRLFAPQPVSGCGNEVFGAEQAYESLDDLWNADADYPPVDALIVTGTESQAAMMEDETSWPHLRKVCDWAAEHTISTIWSCFSAHAAVLHMDGIRRHRMQQKLSGVFQCRKTAEHFIFENLPAQFSVPHSRYNGLAEAELYDRHYQILSYSPDAGVDCFTKQYGRSQFLFLQGHPEYSPQILFNEYCRDVKRFLAGERTDCPNLPENYFDDTTIEAFAALRKLDKALPEGPFPRDFVESIVAKIEFRWRDSAQQLYRAWLCHIAKQKIRDGSHQVAYTNEPKAA